MYKAVTLAGGIREPLLTCSSYFDLINTIQLLYDPTKKRCSIRYFHNWPVYSHRHIRKIYKNKRL